MRITTNFFDKTQYRLYPGPTPYVMHSVHVNSMNPHGDIQFESGAGFAVQHQLLPLFQKAARKRPTLKFIGTAWSANTSRTHGTLTDSSFVVYDGDEPVGTIMWAYGRGSERSFCLDSPALAANRERGQYTSTKSEARALSLLMKAYHRKSPTQRLREVRADATGLYDTMYAGMKKEYDEALRKYQTAALNWVQQNLDTFLSVPGHEEHVRMPERQRDLNSFLKDTQSVSNTYDHIPTATQSLLVIKQPTGWIVCPARNTSTSKFVAEADMPEDIRGKLAVLSLLDKGVVQPGIGSRVSLDTFTVVDAVLP
jgi:hypothetical protein